MQAGRQPSCSELSITIGTKTDDEWKIFVGSGSDTPELERRVVPLGVLLEAEKSLFPAIDLCVGTGLWRDAVSEWYPWGNSGEAADSSTL
jgi:hypothetical protein